MVAPPPIYRQSLTGRARPRRTWTGRVVLQVEVLFERLQNFYPIGTKPPVLSTHTQWRDARMNDQLEHVYGRAAHVAPSEPSHIRRINHQKHPVDYWQFLSTQNTMSTNTNTTTALNIAAWRLTNTAFRSRPHEYHTTREAAETRQHDFNMSCDDGGLHNLTPLVTLANAAAAIAQRDARIAELEAALAAAPAAAQPVAWGDRADNGECVFATTDEDGARWRREELGSDMRPLVWGDGAAQAQPQPLSETRILEIISGLPREDFTREGWVTRTRIAWARAIECEHGIGGAAGATGEQP